MKERMLETLEEIDMLLDKLDLLVNELPIPAGVKREICSNFYDVWAQVEEAVEVRASDFD
jgi:hypothetical protein